MDTNPVKPPEWRDGGWRSRKMWFAAGAIATLYFGMVQAVENAAVRPLYETFAGSVVAICGMVIVGNIAAKVASAKATAPAATNPPAKAVAAKAPAPEERAETSPLE